MNLVHKIILYQIMDINVFQIIKVVVIILLMEQFIHLKKFHLILRFNVNNVAKVVLLLNNIIILINITVQIFVQILQVHIIKIILMNLFVWINVQINGIQILLTTKQYVQTFKIVVNFQIII